MNCCVAFDCSCVMCHMFQPRKICDNVTRFGIYNGNRVNRFFVVFFFSFSKRNSKLEKRQCKGKCRKDTFFYSFQNAFFFFCISHFCTFIQFYLCVSLFHSFFFGSFIYLLRFVVAFLLNEKLSSFQLSEILCWLSIMLKLMSAFSM